jgi:predicted TIM-barrel fold metal-dependent hydrolase
MPIIDAHAHIYPQKIAERAVDGIGDMYNYGAMYGKGTAEHLIGCTADTPITHFLVHSVATTARSVPHINDFLAQEQRDYSQFVAFGTMHQDFADKEAEVNRALSLGLHGFKLHPDTQRVNMDDPRLMEFYEIIAGRAPLVVHTGDYRYDYSSPKRLLHILKTFPDLVVDAAHMGGWSQFDRGYDTLHDIAHASDRVFVDASSTVHFTGTRHLRELIDMWGADRVMFGSDYPMWNPGGELEQLRACGLSEDDWEKITWHNAERFTGVTIG